MAGTIPDSGTLLHGAEVMTALSFIVIVLVVCAWVAAHK